jgi:hypothetical protein
MLAAGACGSSNSSGDGGTDADSDGDTDTDSETETETDTDSLLPTPECAEDGDCAAPLICNELWGLCVVADCAEQDDFVPCEIVTDPDRAYDICIRGACQSPGCGSVDCNPPGPHFPLGDSNQRTCYGGGYYDDEPLDECPAPGEDYYGQDAQFGWDTLHDHSERYTRSLPVPDEPIVEDHATGLVWQGCGSSRRGADCEIAVDDGYVQWKQALARCDALAWGGYHDWRLPDRWELESLLLDDEVPYGCCDQEAFPGCHGTITWTISKSAYSAWDDEEAFISWFEWGDINTRDIFQKLSARCVRGVPNPRPRARWERDTAVPHQPVVHDHATGLVWQGCPKGLGGDDCQLGSLEKATWKGALDTCAFLSSLGWGGRDDWRVPSRHELSSIVDDRFFHPALDPEAFDVTYYDSTWGGLTWTSTSVRDWGSALEARTMYLGNGTLPNGGEMPKSSGTAEVRCVAGGQ